MAFPTISSQQPATHRRFFRDLASASVRQEFVEGVVYPRPSVGPVHQRVLANVVSALTPQITGSPCTLYQDTMVGRGAYIESTPPGEYSYSTAGVFVMPDLVVMLDRPEYFVPSNSIIVNPTVIIEVLVQGEEEYSAGPRFAALRRWLPPSWYAYMLITSTPPEIACYVRMGRDDWRLETCSGFDDVVRIPRVGCALMVGEAFVGIRDEGGRPLIMPRA